MEYPLSIIRQAREAERQSISRELHDSVAQSLCLAELLLQKMRQNADPDLQSQLDEVYEIIKDASLELRRISSGSSQPASTR